MLVPIWLFCKGLLLGFPEIFVVQACCFAGVTFIFLVTLFCFIFWIGNLILEYGGCSYYSWGLGFDWFFGNLSEMYPLFWENIICY